jgi:Fe-S-cluster containining protein
MAALPPIPSDCLLCGTCCFSNLPEYIRVFGIDYDRLDDAARAYTHFIGNRCYMQIDDGHCAALQIQENGRFVCRIYPQRPDVCRSLERGSGSCAGELAEKRDRPLLALEKLVRRG